MSVLMRPDGTNKTVVPANGTDWKLDELYRLLGCKMIEIVHAKRKGFILIIDEEGKFVAEPQVNRLATQEAHIFEWDVIVGNALLCPRYEVK
jgi:hypothetical protein